MWIGPAGECDWLCYLKSRAVRGVETSGPKDGSCSCLVVYCGLGWRKGHGSLWGEKASSQAGDNQASWSNLSLGRGGSLPPLQTTESELGTAQGGGGSPGFRSQAGYSEADDCEQVASALPPLGKMGIRLFAVLLWPGLGGDVHDSTWLTEC